MKTKTLTVLLLLGSAAFAATTPAASSCATTYNVISKDALGNVTQGVSNKNLKWIQQDMGEKYPGTCYAPPGSAATMTFVISVEDATYSGTRIVTSTANTSGNVATNTGGSATYTGSTTSSAAVPYSFEYGRYLLTVETTESGQTVVRHRFTQDGIFHTLYGIPLGGRGHHPGKALIEDALKWVQSGGLSDPTQSAL